MKQAENFEISSMYRKFKILPEILNYIKKFVKTTENFVQNFYLIFNPV